MNWVSSNATHGYTVQTSFSPQLVQLTASLAPKSEIDLLDERIDRICSVGRKALGQ